MRNRVTQNRC